MDETDDTLDEDLNPQPSEEAVQATERTREEFAALRRVGAEMNAAVRMEMAPEPADAPAGEFADEAASAGSGSPEDVERWAFPHHETQPEELNNRGNDWHEAENNFRGSLTGLLGEMTNSIVEHEKELHRLRQMIERSRQ